MVSEATALPTAIQPLPSLWQNYVGIYQDDIPT